jgi:hypothetical protein
MGSVESEGSPRGSAAAALEHLTSQVRRILKRAENEPVGVLTAERDAMLKLADAIDWLAREIDSRTKGR